MNTKIFSIDSNLTIPELIEKLKATMTTNSKESYELVSKYMEALCNKYRDQVFHNFQTSSKDLAEIYIQFLEYAEKAELSENEVEIVRDLVQEYFSLKEFDYFLRSGSKEKFNEETSSDLKIATLFSSTYSSLISQLYSKGLLKDILIIASNNSSRINNFIVTTLQVQKHLDDLDSKKDPIEKSKEIARIYIDFVSSKCRQRNFEIRTTASSLEEYLVKKGMTKLESDIFITNELNRILAKWNPITTNKRYFLSQSKSISFGKTFSFPEEDFQNYVNFLQPHIDRLPHELKELLGTINFYDTNNPFDLYWQTEYNFPDFYSSASSDYLNNIINVFKSSPGDTIHFDIYSLYHELAHAFDYYAAKKLGLNGVISNQPFWKEAIIEDEKASGKQSPSDYGKRSTVEDFAESLSMYYWNYDVFSANFPNRLKILQNLITKYRELDKLNSNSAISKENFRDVAESSQSMEAIEPTLADFNRACRFYINVAPISEAPNRKTILTTENER